MKISALEEYGLRCLLRLSAVENGKSLTINEIARVEGISVAHARKLLMILRESNLVDSVRGRKGGYVLKGDPSEISVGHVMEILGGRMYNEDFCGRFTGKVSICVNSAACSVRSLWALLDGLVGGVLNRIRLSDLLDDEAQATLSIRNHVVETVDEILKQDNHMAGSESQSIDSNPVRQPINN